MGHGTFSHHDYGHRTTLRESGVRPAMAYTTDIIEGRAAREVHAALRPYRVTREARDSAEHPESMPVGVMFDVTGSMGRIPRVFQNKLGNLMHLLCDKGYLSDPQVLMGAIGDATCDTGILQVGQFESNIQIDEDLDRIWVEGGGGGQTTESYELAYYFFARHTATDCWDKRQKKGYLFTMGDEAPYPSVKRDEVRRLLGDSLQADIPFADIVQECSQRWHAFHFLVDTSTLRHDTTITTRWQAAMPSGHVIRLTDPEHVAELVALVVGICEGKVTDAEHDLTQIGLNEGEVASILAALTPLAVTRGIRLRASA